MRIHSSRTRLRPQRLAGPVQPYARRDLADAQRGRRLGDRELVDRDQFQDGSLPRGEPFQGGEYAAARALGVELVLKAGDVVGFQQPAPRDAPVARRLAGHAPVLGGDDDGGPPGSSEAESWGRAMP